MAILGFKKRFADKIRSGKKRQTIRAFRKYPIKTGETLYLYTALRTKYAKKLKEAICLGTYTIHLHLRMNIIILPEHVMNTPKELNAFARRDGFADWDDLKLFWKETHEEDEFKGTLIRW